MKWNGWHFRVFLVAVLLPVGQLAMASPLQAYLFTAGVKMGVAHDSLEIFGAIPDALGLLDPGATDDLTAADGLWPGFWDSRMDVDQWNDELEDVAAGAVSIDQSKWKLTKVQRHIHAQLDRELGTRRRNEITPGRTCIGQYFRAGFALGRAYVNRVEAALAGNPDSGYNRPMNDARSAVFAGDHQRACDFLPEEDWTAETALNFRSSGSGQTPAAAYPAMLSELTVLIYLYGSGAAAPMPTLSLPAPAAFPPPLAAGGAGAAGPSAATSSPAASPDPWANVTVLGNTSTTSGGPGVSPPRSPVENLLVQAKQAADRCDYAAAQTLALRAKRQAPDHPWITANLDLVRNLYSRQQRADAMLAQAEQQLAAGRPQAARRIALSAADIAPSCQGSAIAQLTGRADAAIRNQPKPDRGSSAEAVAATVQATTQAINSAIAASQPAATPRPDPWSASTAGQSAQRDPCQPTSAGHCVCPGYVKRGNRCVSPSQVAATANTAGAPGPPAGQSGSGSQARDSCSFVQQPWPSTGQCASYLKKSTNRTGGEHIDWVVVTWGEGPPPGFLKAHYYVGPCRIATDLDKRCPAEIRQ